MRETAEETVDLFIRSAYALQFTGGTPEARQRLIRATHPDPLVEVDCATLDDYDHFFEAIADDLTTDPANYYGDTEHVRDHLDAEGGSLVLYNYDQMDDDATRGLAMYLKGLAEQVSAKIALTVTDPERIFIANGDLTGRVRTIDLDEFDD